MPKPDPKWEFVLAVRAWGTPYDSDDNTLVDGVRVILVAKNYAVKIVRLAAVNPGNGAGTAFLKRLTAFADERGITLALTAGPLERLPDAGVSDKGRIAYARRLAKWYKTFGFTGHYSAMSRKPVTRKPRCRRRTKASTRPT